MSAVFNLKKFQKLKKKYSKIYKFLKNLNFILRRVKHRLIFTEKNFLSILKPIKIYHNKIIFFNFQSLKFFFTKKQKEIKNLIITSDNKFFFKRKLKKKKKLFLLKKKIFFKYKKYNNFTTNTFNIYDFYNKILLTTFRVGKKSKWNVMLLNLFDLLCTTLKYSISILFLKIFIRLFTRVELKKIKSRKRVTFIPFFIKPKRSLFLALKWIFLSASKSLNTTSYQNKLYVELIQLLTFKTCYSIQKLEENNINSFKNRSNVHYRWQKAR